MRQARSDVEKQATGMMDRGMELQNQTQVIHLLYWYFTICIPLYYYKTFNNYKLSL